MKYALQNYAECKTIIKLAEKAKVAQTGEKWNVRNYKIRCFKRWNRNVSVRWRFDEDDKRMHKRLIKAHVKIQGNKMINNMV